MNTEILEISCNLHGPMKYRSAEARWICAGFDGEGCDLYLEYGEAEDIDGGKPLSRVAAGEFAWTYSRYPGCNVQIELWPPS